MWRIPLMFPEAVASSDFRRQIVLPFVALLIIISAIQVWAECPEDHFSVAITSPANGASFEIGSPIIIVPEFSDITNSIDKVFCTANGKQVAGSTIYPFQLHWASPLIGDYDLKLKAVDIESKEAFSKDITIHIVKSSPANSSDDRSKEKKMTDTKPKETNSTTTDNSNTANNTIKNGATINANATAPLAVPAILPPVLTSPGNFKKGLPALSIKLSWSPSLNATSYFVTYQRVAPLANLASPIIPVGPPITSPFPIVGINYYQTPHLASKYNELFATRYNILLDY